MNLLIGVLVQRKDREHALTSGKKKLDHAHLLILINVLCSFSADEYMLTGASS